MANTYQKISSSRLLPERARIEFHYGGQELGDTQIVFLPFYENPKISESQTTSYAEYNPVGRAGSLYAYMGAKSRKFKVDINYTLPHLAEHDMGIGRFLRIYFNKDDKLRFFNDAWKPKERKPGDTIHSLSLAAEKDFLNIMEEKTDMLEKFYYISSRKGGVLDDLIKNIGEETLHNIYLQYMEGSLNPDILDNPSFLYGLFTATDSASRHQIANMDAAMASVATKYPGFIEGAVPIEGEWRYMHRVIDTLLFFIAVLRTSVTNNAEDPMLGPPLLRLSFGTMYQSVPCICKSYNLSWEEDAGYHLETLTPRHLQIQLNLEEIRVGDFEEYQPATFAKRDNLAGWESAIGSPYTNDPLPVEGYWKGT